MDKAEAILRVLRGEELDALWTPADDEVRELKTLIGELPIDNESRKALWCAHEGRNPLARRRSKP